ncbi:MAG: sigma 54-interacting transcriptional regulator [Phycisphaerales bacterium]|nr:sigma 54-interacting transcriptional regulator [Phycisphaerales bacterium]
MCALTARAEQVAPRKATILIQGETGCGKEMLARHIWASSRRAHRPFIPVDCSTLNDHLIESELFGHVRGAFTGATQDTLGLIRSGNGGTVFLDEIGELPLPQQAKLLRVLQERTVLPVGSTKRFPVDVRFMAATNRPLIEMVHQGTFRADLYYRLNVINLRVPALRQRPLDIVPLARHFIDQQAALYDEPPCILSASAAEALRAWHWPGNVRELSNIIEQMHILCSGRAIELDDLPPHFHSGPPVSTSDGLRLEDVERRTIIEALHRTNYCKAAAGRLLNLNIQRLNRRIVRLNIPMH